MDVSNSSDQNTGYRVVGGGQAPTNMQELPTESGNLRPPKILKHGHLRPHEYVTLDMKEDVSWVEFDLPGQTKPRRVKVPKGETRHLLVALIPNGDGGPKPFVCRRRPEDAPGSRPEQGGSATA